MDGQVATTWDVSPHLGLITPRHVLDRVVDIGHPRRLINLFFRSIKISVRDVVVNRVVEEDGVLMMQSHMIKSKYEAR